MRRLLALVALAFILAFPGCKSAEEIAKEKAAAEADMKLLDGRWTIAELAGDPDVAEDEDNKKPKSFEVKIENGILKRMNNGEVFQRQKMTIYAHKDPKQIDLVDVKEDGTAEQRKYREWVRGSKSKAGKWVDRTGVFKVVGLYKVTGDTLEMCMSYTDKDRPTELSRGPNRELIKLKRIGKAPETEKKDAEKKDGEKKDGEKKDAEKKDGEKKDGEKKDAEPKDKATKLKAPTEEK